MFTLMMQCYQHFYWTDSQNIFTFIALCRLPKKRFKLLKICKIFSIFVTTSLLYLRMLKWFDIMAFDLTNFQQSWQHWYPVTKPLKTHGKVAKRRTFVRTPEHQYIFMKWLRFTNQPPEDLETKKFREAVRCERKNK